MYDFGNKTCYNPTLFNSKTGLSDIKNPMSGYLCFVSMHPMFFLLRTHRNIKGALRIREGSPYRPMRMLHAR